MKSVAPTKPLDVHGLPMQTASLVLRHFVARDAEPIRQLNAEPTTSRWLPSHVYANTREAEETLELLISCYTHPGTPQYGPYVLAVERRLDGQLLGHVGFSPLDGEVEVSYAIAETARGHAYGAEALANASIWASQSFGLPKLIALTAPQNTASRCTLLRARFSHARDEAMQFQGSWQTIGRFEWRASSAKSDVVRRD